MPIDDLSLFGDITLKDLLLSDGLLDAFDGRHMAEMCECLSKQYEITRNEQE